MARLCTTPWNMSFLTRIGARLNQKPLRLDHPAAHAVRLAILSRVNAPNGLKKPPKVMPKVVQTAGGLCTSWIDCLRNLLWIKTATPQLLFVYGACLHPQLTIVWFGNACS
jgi:hypothetical protein